MVIRDSWGDVVAWSRKRVAHCQNPEVAEALAVRCAIQLPLEQNIHKLVIEGDCSAVIRELQESVPALSIDAWEHHPANQIHSSKFGDCSGIHLYS